MKNKLMAVYFVLILILCGCSSNQQEQVDPIEIHNDNADTTSVLYEFAHGIKGYTGTELALNDFNEFTYEINNKNKALDLGLIFFADGYLQRYKTEDEENLDYLHSISVEKSKIKDIKIIMESYQLDNKNTHSFNIGGVLNPSVIKDLASYQVNHSISQSSGISVQSLNTDFQVKHLDKENTFSEVPITESDKQQLNISSFDDLNQNMRIKVLQDNKEVKDYINTEKSIDIYVTGDYGLYNMYIFVDGRPYNPEEFVYPIESKKGYFSIQSLKLPVELKEKKNLFFVFAPKNTVNFIEQSERYMIGSE